MSLPWLKLTLSIYFLSSNPGGDFLWGYALLAFFLVLIFLPVIIRKIAPNSKYFRKSIRHKFGKFIALGIIGLLLVISRFSMVPFFSMRLWLYIILVLSIFFGIRTFFIVRKDYKERLLSVEREKQRSGHR